MSRLRYSEVAGEGLTPDILPLSRLTMETVKKTNFVVSSSFENPRESNLKQTNIGKR